jgi:pyrroline-5-carboxylate reductase
MKLGIIGLGKMGEALVRGIERSGDRYAIEATTRSQDSAKEAQKKLGVPVHTDNTKLLSHAEVVLLCVKPHQVEALLTAVSECFTPKHTLISICASITTEQLSDWSGGRCAVIRAMPNTPALIREGITVMASGPRAESKHLAQAEKVFRTVGQTAKVEESLLDGVTGLSGCGPAYVYMIIEALSEAGVKVGLPRKTATLLAAQTLLGASKMVLERGEHPAALKDEVTTPAGCTIDGLMALEEGALRATLIRAVVAATKRSKTLREPTR